MLTCSHCFCDFKYEYQADSKRRWLLSYTGLAVQIECRFWDSKRDLALCKIIAIESDVGKSGDVATFHYVRLASSAPRVKSSVICIGQPGADDLESKVARRTKYNLVEVSEGTFRGLVRDVDPQDNSDIGAMMHDAWTYWGHSGVPLLRSEDKALIGLHSSWDDQTAMRHGIPLAAIQEFLQQHLPSALLPDASDSAMLSVGRLQLQEEGPENSDLQSKAIAKAPTKKQSKANKSSRRSPIMIDDD